MIEITNLNFKYPDSDEYTLKDISFILSDGEIMIIEGDNGAGKTTLIKNILGILTPDADSEILIEKLNVRENIDEIINHGYIDFCYSNPDLGIVNELVFEEIAFSLENRQYPTAVIIQKVENVLSKFQISHLKNRLYESLSKSERKRVALAACFVGEAKHLILDDPMYWLDEEGLKLLFEISKDYCRSKDKSILIISHKPDEMQKVYASDYLVKRYKLNDTFLTSQ